jgi:hypothetical protein
LIDTLAAYANLFGSGRKRCAAMRKAPSLWDEA